MNDSGCFTAKNITGSPDANNFKLAYSTLAGDSQISASGF